jgi:dTDP-4-dehydrorhamnose reductase
VVDDQRGAPTSSEAIAAAVARILSRRDFSKKASGVYHLSAAGETTWHGFAREILALRGLQTRLTPVSSAEYGAVARRPKNSLLDNSKAAATFGVALPDWHESLAAVLRDV